MKKVTIFLTIVFLSSVGKGTEIEKCLNAAEKAAAVGVELSVKQFRASKFGLVRTCGTKTEPSLREFQFGDGSSIVGVSVKIVGSKCKILNVYTGQDDHDADEESDSICF